MWVVSSPPLFMIHSRSSLDSGLPRSSSGRRRISFPTWFRSFFVYFMYACYCLCSFKNSIHKYISSKHTEDNFFPSTIKKKFPKDGRGERWEGGKGWKREKVGGWK